MENEEELWGGTDARRERSERKKFKELGLKRTRE
jgi:hypothetical protein